MILATDYDGTLCRGVITDEDRAAIIRFREAGNLFGVVTGRDFPMAYGPLTGDGGVPFDFIIAMNGALAVDREGNILFERRADGVVLPELIRTVCEVGGSHLGCVTGKTRREFSLNVPDGDDFYAPLSDARAIKGFTQGNTWCDNTEITAKAVGIIKERHGAYINVFQNHVCIDMPPIGVDKGTGVAELADIFGVPHGEIWTAGDNYNDLPMLTRFRGCAMENGVQAVKEAARGVYPDIASIIDEMMG
ncbi:MAG: HAD-IIB family hydrolase [Ruminococcaceae bacterium]|nr:HAD-IIB family hydrolase [Oscillospiraceae bacterium]